MLGIDRERLELARSVGDRLVPEDIAPRLHRDLVVSEPPPDDDVLDRGRVRQRLVDERLHRHLAAPAQRAVGGDDHLRLGVLEPPCDRGRCEAREDRHLDRAQVRARVRGDRDLRRHRQEERHPVAGADAERRQRLGEAGDRLRELAVGERAPLPVLALPHRGLLVGAGAAGPAVDTVPGDVQLAADEPGSPLGPVRLVHDRVPGLREVEAQVLDRRRPEALRVVLREAHERRVVVETQLARQAERVRALAHLVGRSPDRFHARPA